jgi:AcrR family transcriptional regulator
MVSVRTTDPARTSPPTALSTEDRILDAARGCILAVGWRRTTLTDVAKRADLSRMTVYRAYGDMPSIMSELLTREWADVYASASPGDGGQPSAGSVARAVTRAVAAARSNPLLHRVLEVDPELLLPYLVERRGRSGEAILTALSQEIVNGQKAGKVRAGDPKILARTIALLAQGFVISLQTQADDGVSEQELADELTTVLERYLQP